MGITRNQVIAIGLVLVVIVFYGGYRYGQAKANVDGVILELGEFTGRQGQLGDSSRGEAPPEINNSSHQEALIQEKNIFVHVTGAVQKPGLYQLPEGARVNDGIILAMPTDEANLDALNLAHVLADGNKIIVPSRLEEGDNSLPGSSNGGIETSVFIQGTAEQTGKVNINIAGADELAAKLPGIGPVLAQRIVDYRTTNGLFQKPQDLTNVSGIGAKTYESLQDLVIVR